MLHADEVEELVCLISCFDRATVTRQLLEFHAHFPVDFTADFLLQQTVDRLRHLLFALCMQCRQVPDMTTPIAA